MLFSRNKLEIPSTEDALPGREAEMPLPDRHAVLRTPLKPPFPEGIDVAQFGLGCFWGAEQLFWQLDGVYTTAVGYAGGATPNPTYEEVCSGRTGHTEAVLVAYDPAKVSYEDLLRTFWEGPDPTPGVRPGNDVCTQNPSGNYTHDHAPRAPAEASRERYQAALSERGLGEISTEIAEAGPFYYA